ncbi:MAG: hypothetical protein ABMA64_17995 [Myxococcota bacterium]
MPRWSLWLVSCGSAAGDRADYPTLYQPCDADVGCDAPLTCELVAGAGQDTGLTPGEAAVCTLTCTSDADCPTCDGQPDRCDGGVCAARDGCHVTPAPVETTLP